MMYGYYGGHMGPGAWIVMAVANLAFWIVLAGLIYAALRSGVFGSTRHDARETPSEVLAHRFARGEIDAEEYAARLHVLEQQGR